MERFKKFYTVIKTSINFIYSEVETDVSRFSFENIEDAKEELIRFAESEYNYFGASKNKINEDYIREHLEEDGMKFQIETDADGLDIFEVKETEITERYLKID